MQIKFINKNKKKKIQTEWSRQTSYFCQWSRSKIKLCV